MAADKSEEAIADEVLDELLKGRDPQTVFESGGLVDELKKRAGGADAECRDGPASSRGNGARGRESPQRLRLQDRPDRIGKLELSIPRDRHGRFDPLLIAKYRRRFPGFDDKIIALYARGMSTARDPGACRASSTAIEISPDLVSAVTDAVLDEVGAWQSRGRWRRSMRSCSSTPAGEDPRRGRGEEQGGLPGDRRALLGHTRRSWACGSSRPRGRNSGCG